jgi:murein DD-endopeptidase MepM/ murein hydrolase activator NlpD
MSSDVLRVGQTLKIPGASQPSSSTVTVVPTAASDTVPDSSRASKPTANRNLAQLQVLTISESVKASLATDQASALENLREKRNRLKSSLAELQDEESSASLISEISETETDSNLTGLMPLDQLQQAETGVISAEHSNSDQSGSESSESAAFPVDSSTEFVVYRVASGDTLGAIAKKHQISQEFIIKANQIEQPDRLAVDQALIIPKVDADSARADYLNSLEADTRAEFPSIPLVQTDLPGSDDAIIIHKVRSEETVGAIARHYNLSQQSLVSLNSLDNPNLIREGQELVIPLAELAQLNGASEFSGEAKFDGEFSANSNQAETDASPSFLAASGDRPTPLNLVDKPTPLSSLAKSQMSGTQSSETGVAISQPIEEQTEATEPLQVAIDSQNVPTSAAAGSNPYVENLMVEIRALSAQYRGEAAESQAQPSELVASSASDLGLSYLRSTRLSDSLNPQFVDRDEAIATEQVSQRSSQVSDTGDNSESSEQSVEVATAPLGSQNYRLSEPITGRMVSPELPPMPGPENYLPEGAPLFNGYRWPARGVLTSGYGWRWGRMHQGIDIAAPVGTPIFAAAPGVIEFSGWNSGGYGNMVDIRHPDGSKTRYAHNSRNLVRAGQQVEQGQQIALMGSTGYSTGPHVHFEVHLPNRGTVNPVAYLPSR